MGYLEGSKLELALRNRLEVLSWNWAATVISCGTYLLNSEALGVELGQQGIGDLAFCLGADATDLHVSRHSCFAKRFFWLTSR